jgi:membrane protein DedA with SNARE-associated domain
MIVALAIISPLKEIAFNLITQYGYIGIFSLLVLGIVGLPVPDELMLTFAGYLVYKGVLHFAPTLATAFLGSLCGITLSYVLGRTLGMYLIEKYGPVVHITTDKVNRVHNWFDRVGKWSLTFGYFVPGVRHLTAYVAGTSKLELPLFGLFAYTGALIWSATFICAGYLLGERWAQAVDTLHGHFLLPAGLVILLLLFYSLMRQWRRG